MRSVGRLCVAAGVLALPLGIGLAATGHADEIGAAELVPATPCTRAAEACVSVADRTAWLLKDGVVTYGPVLISTGAEGEETPTGAFRVEWKDPTHISGESGVPMPFSVFFAPGGIGFHEGSIYRESGGCVHLRREDATVFYDTLTVGDDVEVH